MFLYYDMYGSLRKEKVCVVSEVLHFSYSGPLWAQACTRAHRFLHSGVIAPHCTLTSSPQSHESFFIPDKNTTFDEII